MTRFPYLEKKNTNINDKCYLLLLFILGAIFFIYVLPKFDSKYNNNVEPFAPVDKIGNDDILGIFGDLKYCKDCCASNNDNFPTQIEEKDCPDLKGYYKSGLMIGSGKCACLEDKHIKVLQNC